MSNACAEDGACVPTSDVLNIAVDGVDAGTCTAVAPCKKISFAATKAGGTRVHIVINPATYFEKIAISSVAAPSIFIHGGGATVRADPTGNGTILSISGTSVMMNDLTLVPGDTQSSSDDCMIFGSGTFTLDRIRVMNSCGVTVSGTAVMRDIAFEAGTGLVALNSVGLKAFGALTLDRGVIRGGRLGLEGAANTILDVNNLLVFGTSDLGIRLPGASGTIKFSTIANVGTATATGPHAVSCSSGLTISHSIIWAPGPTTAPIQGCSTVGSFVGPMPVAGAQNVDPVFVSAGANDFRLSPNSPAKDLVDSGPAFDFEGQARPQGPRFDIGADEAPP